MRVFSRRDVLALLSLTDCIAAVEHAFRLHAEGRTLGPGVLGVPARGGGFHIKAAGLLGERSWFAAKTNANFPENPQRFGLPTIQGTVVLADAGTGEPLAVMDSASVTALHNHALGDQPRLFYMHFWANDDPARLAGGLRAALDQVNTAPPS